MVTIKDADAVQILDSRGNPTVRVILSSEQYKATANVPSGASTGSHEAHELRDGDEPYDGKGVQDACENVRTVVREAVVGKAYTSVEEFDNALIVLDGTEHKSNLGANAILGCSIAFCRLLAKSQGQHPHALFGKNVELPTPYCNIINGGVHAGNEITIQEFMVVPHGFDTFATKTQAVAEIYAELKQLITKRYGSDAVGVGDEGGFAPPLKKTRDALNLIMQAVQKRGYGGKVALAIDAAASEFYNDGVYDVDGTHMEPEELLTYYEALIEEYPIISLEDPFHEDDFSRYAALLDSIGESCQIVGDDLTVTNVERVQQAIDKGSANSLLLKVNQIGSVSESIEAAQLAMENGWTVMVSHRSGETEDPFIMDLAIGIGATQVKIGAPCRGERTAKYNRLLEIEHLH